MKKISKFGWSFIILSFVSFIYLLYANPFEVDWKEESFFLKIFGIAINIFWSILIAGVFIAILGILLIIIDHVKSIIQKIFYKK